MKSNVKYNVVRGKTGPWNQQIRYIDHTFSKRSVIFDSIYIKTKQCPDYIRNVSYLF